MVYQRLKRCRAGLLANCFDTLPYFACHAKKYSSAASGCPTRQKETQKIMLPATLPRMPFIFWTVSVRMMRGIWIIMPAKATPVGYVSEHVIEWKIRSEN